MSSEDRYKVGMRSEDRWVRMSSEDKVGMRSEDVYKVGMSSKDR